MNRRQFLRTAAAAGGVAALAGPVRAASAAPDLAFKLQTTLTNAMNLVGSVLNQPAQNSPVDTIVILMMENRSFDHYLGWLADDDDYLENGRRRYGRNFRVDGVTDQSFLDPSTGRMVDTYHLTSNPDESHPWRGCGHPDPGHGPVQGRAQRDHGFLAKDSGNDEFALGYFTERDLPMYAPLARNFTIFDRYFCSIMSSTYPNRLYLQSAQCGPTMDPGLPIADLGFDWPCIWDRLLAAGVSCANYALDIPSSLFFGPRAIPIIRPFADFFVDAAIGNLPRVVLLDPGFLSGFRTDDHPVGDMRVAQSFVANVVRALTRSPQWSRTALFVTYDEWGGFFDHVTPPVLPDARASKVDANNFGQAGFRIPTFMVSPYARPGFVDHRVYDHASILRFIEWRFLGAPPEGPGGSGWWLTERDRYANNIGMSLQSTRQADIHKGLIPEIPLQSTPCQGFWFQDVPEIDNHDRAGEFAAIEEPISGMELFRVSGYLERLGVELKPSLSRRELLG